MNKETLEFLENITKRNKGEQTQNEIDRERAIAFAAGKLKPQQDDRPAVRFLTGKGKFYRER